MSNIFDLSSIFIKQLWPQFCIPLTSVTLVLDFSNSCDLCSVFLNYMWPQYCINQKKLLPSSSKMCDLSSTFLKQQYHHPPGVPSAPGILRHVRQVLRHLRHEHRLPVLSGGEGDDLFWEKTTFAERRRHVLREDDLTWEKTTCPVLQTFVQVLPTTLRGQGMAVVHLMSMLSQMASPIVVYSVSRSCWCWVMFVVLALVLVKL